MTKVKYPEYLSTIFSPKVLWEISEDGFSKTFYKILNITNFISEIKKNDTYNEIFNKIFKYLEKNYKNEYVYKNYIANEILLKKHSNATLLSELRAGTSKADVVILNGTSSVYEIKTELDSLDRLEKQLDSYLKVFDRIYVVAHTKQANKIIKVLPKNVGLIEFTEKNELKTIKKHISNIANIDNEIIFEIFRKDEYMDIVKNYFNINTITIPNTKIYGVVKSLFKTLSAKDAHSIMVKQLKKRNIENMDLVSEIAKSLISNILTTKLNEHAKRNLVCNLDKICISPT